MNHFLLQAFIYLLAAVITVPLAKRFGLGSVLGYLLAGVVIGPPLLGIVEADAVKHFAEFGVVMMLFLIGLELRPELLWRLRGPVFGLGGFQVLFTAASVAALSLLFHVSWQSAVAIGLILAMSSTAIVLQSLAEKGLLKTRGGEACFSVLLMQDLAVIPILAILPLLANHAPSTHDVTHNALGNLPKAVQALITIGSVALIVLAGRYVVRPAFHVLAQAKLREMFTAGSLLIVIGIACLMELVGLSAALGAFVGGVVLADSEYRHELEADIEPFKGLLLGLFFIAVGAGIDFSVIRAQPALVLGLVAGLVLVKLVILFILSRIAKVETKEGLLFAFALAQGGEFCFVLLDMASGQSVLDTHQTRVLTAVVALSMAVTPLLFLVYERLVAPRFKQIKPERAADEIDEKENPVILIGYGRFGHIVGRFIRSQGYGVTVLDSDADQVELVAKFGSKTFYGDATRPELLAAAGAANAKLLVLALADEEGSLKIVEHAKRTYPHLRILARAYGRQHADVLHRAGVEDVFRDTLGSALDMGANALRTLGFRGHSAHRASLIFKKHENEALKKLALREDDKDLDGYISAVRKHMHNLEQALQLDRGTHATIGDTAWMRPGQVPLDAGDDEVK